MMAVLRDRRGFGLVELLIALALVVVVMAGASVALDAGVRTVQTGAGRAETQSGARVAIGRMVPDIREAGYDPNAVGFDAVIKPGVASVTLQSDRDASGVIEAAAVAGCDPTGPSEVVRYRAVGGELRRSVNPADDSCETVLVTGVQALSFSYLDAAGNVTGTPAGIRTVAISVSIVPAGGGNPQQPTAVLMTDRVRLRNR
jgi:prepilin-type N-terminal cleavage/methylation domain-containing protein